MGASCGAQSRLHGSRRICFTVIYRTHAFPLAPPLHFARISCLQPLILQCIALPCCAQGILVLALWFIACLMLSSLHAGAAGRLSAQARTESIGAATAGVRLGQCDPDLRLQLYFGLGQVAGRMHSLFGSSLRIARAHVHSREVPQTVKRC